MKRNLISTAVLLICGMLAFGGTVQAAPSKCPTCGKEYARSLSDKAHHYFSGLGKWQHQMTHGEWYVFGCDRKDITTEEGLSYANLEFDGNPINLPINNGYGRYADGRISEVCYYVWGNIYNLNMEKGTYERFDGQTYKFDPVLFTGCMYDGMNIQSVFFIDARVFDWMAVHNSLPPQDVLDAMQKAVDNYTEDLNQREEYYYWYEVALEKLYGLWDTAEDASSPEANAGYRNVCLSDGAKTGEFDCI